MEEFENKNEVGMETMEVAECEAVGSTEPEVSSQQPSIWQAAGNVVVKVGIVGVIVTAGYGLYCVGVGLHRRFKNKKQAKAEVVNKNGKKVAETEFSEKEE